MNEEKQNNFFSEAKSEGILFAAGARSESAKPQDPSAVSLSREQLSALQKLADNLKEGCIRLADSLAAYSLDQQPTVKIRQAETIQPADISSDQRIIEGWFNGEKMVGPDNQLYDVPVNYASKSKLVEGDQLKLIITANGSFVYKQIKPVERQRLVGILEQTPIGEYLASLDNRHWRLLTASVTYYHGELGDEVVILAPKNGQAVWAAVDNIVKKSNF